MSEDRKLSRRDLLKKGAAGAAAFGAAGATAPFSFAGPLKYKGRYLSGNLSLITWVHFVPAYDQWLDPWAKAVAGVEDWDAGAFAYDIGNPSDDRDLVRAETDQLQRAVDRLGAGEGQGEEDQRVQRR